MQIFNIKHNPILHTKHDATLCECIFFHRKCIFKSIHVYCYDCIDALYMQLIITNTCILYMRWLVSCVVRHDDDGIKMRRNGDSGNVYITGRVHIHSPVLHPTY